MKNPIRLFSKPDATSLSSNELPRLTRVFDSEGYLVLPNCHTKDGFGYP